MSAGEQVRSESLASQPGVVLITGASSGFGRAAALTLASSGWHVIGAFRGSGKGFESAAHKLGQAGVQCVRADVTNVDSVAAAVTDTVSRFGRIDAVINAAGYGLLGPMECTPMTETLKLYETNVFGTMRVCQAVLPILRAQGAGRIINIGSDVGLRANYFQSSYAASKFAIDGFSQSLRLEVRRFGVAVSLVSPGWYATEFGKSAVTTFQQGQYAPAYAELIADWERGVDAVEGPNNCPQQVADVLAGILAEPNPRFRYTVGWNSERMGPVDVGEIDQFQHHLIEYYQLDSPTPGSTSRVR